MTSGLGIKNVHLYSLPGMEDSVLTKKSGGFLMKLHRKKDTILFYHPEFIPKAIYLKRIDGVTNVQLNRWVIDSTDFVLPKNTISFLPIKLITGALAFRLERIFKTKYSVGTYLCYYYNGRQYFGIEKFTGLKASPYFRYYFKRNKSYGFYAQLAVIIAYFDFRKLNYNYEEYYTKSISTNFWTGGIGAFFGITDVVRNTKHFIIDINVGWQLLTFPVETTIIGDHGEKYNHNPAWWFAGGPGSLIEIKLAIGGIF